MKKIMLLAAALSVSLLLYGCGQDKERGICALGTEKEYSFTFTAQKDDFCFSGTLERMTDGVYNATVLSPELLNGTQIRTTEDGIEARKNGMSAVISSENPPVGFFISVLSDTVKKLENGEFAVFSSDEAETEYSVPADKSGGVYTVKYDRTRKMITSIKISGLGELFFDEGYR